MGLEGLMGGTVGLVASPPATGDLGGGGMSLTVRRDARTGYGFIEPYLDVGDAIPLHMVQIPAGTFLMGSPENEPEREASESP